MPQRDSYSAGTYGATVRVYRRKPRGPFHYEIRSTGPPRSRGSRGRSPAVPRAWCHTAAEDLAKGIEHLAAGQTTLGLIFDTYLENRTPKKRTKGERDADHRRADMWKARLGANRLPHEIRLFDWESFIEDRGKGRICSHHRREAHGKSRARCPGPKPTTPRTVQADLLWIRGVFNWAASWRLPSGRRRRGLAGAVPFHAALRPQALEAWSGKL